jgi:parallel beta-helix repeat protein
MRLHTGAVLFLLVIASSLQGTVYRVPEQFPAIQDAIDASAAGDTVLVANGIYGESIDFYGKGIVVVSEEGPLYTTIDGEEFRRVVTFSSGEDSTAKLIGFSITNGFVNAVGGGGVLCDGSSPVLEQVYMAYNTSWGWNVHGGGMLCCNEASPQVRKCRFVENRAEFQQESGGGAGLACIDGASPYVQFCHFSGNRTTGGWGGGIYCENYSNPFIYDNKIYDNFVDYYKGGGICCQYYCSPVIEANEITDNTAGFGAGIYCGEYSSPEITDNYIARNSANIGARCGGAGIACRFFSDPVIRNNIIEENETSMEGGGVGCFWYSTPLIAHNLFKMNISNEYGGAVNCWWKSDATITGNTFYENTAMENGASIRSYYSTPVIRENIIASNRESVAIYNNSDTEPEEDYNLFWDNPQGHADGFTLGIGEVYCDPLFADSEDDDFTLSIDSPAIDAGDPLSEVPENGGPRRDLGCYEFQYRENSVLDFSFSDIPDSVEQRHSMSCTYTVENASDSTVTTDLWIETSGELCELIRLKLSITLEPYESYNHTMSLPVGAYITPGVYSVKGRTGDYGEMMEAGDAFEVEVIPYRGTSIYVPEDYSTIQEAIDAAIDMDSVLVAPGEYVECIDFLGKAIVLRSEEGYDVTTIDADSMGTVVSFVTGETELAVLDGFTITGGVAQYGGGILCYNSDPFITNNNITGNTAAGGGGIVCAGSVRPTVTGNIIAGNSASSFGGGVVSAKNNETLVLDNLIQGNTAPNGGGVWIGVSGKTRIAGNTLQLNTADECGGGIAVESGSTPELFNNILIQNSAALRGGGIFLSQDVTTDLTNNTLIENSAPEGGGIGCFDSCTVTMRNTIIASSPSGYGVWVADLSHVTLSSNNVWNNLEDNYFGCEPDSMSISTDPLFVEGPLGSFYLSHIQAGQDTTSPCVDAGDTLAVELGLDARTTRTDSAPDSSTVDTGYHYPFSM